MKIKKLLLLGAALCLGNDSYCTAGPIMDNLSRLVDYAARMVAVAPRTPC
jgi:hypothetical protein